MAAGRPERKPAEPAFAGRRGERLPWSMWLGRVGTGRVTSSCSLVSGSVLFVLKLLPRSEIEESEYGLKSKSLLGSGSALHTLPSLHYQYCVI